MEIGHGGVVACSVPYNREGVCIFESTSTHCVGT